jgi:chaperone required for assembly of F1-ATPase
LFDESFDIGAVFSSTSNTHVAVISIMLKRQHVAAKILLSIADRNDSYTILSWLFYANDVDDWTNNVFERKKIVVGER